MSPAMQSHGQSRALARWRGSPVACPPQSATGHEHTDWLFRFATGPNLARGQQTGQPRV